MNYRESLITDVDRDNDDDKFLFTLEIDEPLWEAFKQGEFLYDVNDGDTVADALNDAGRRDEVGEMYNSLITAKNLTDEIAIVGGFVPIQYDTPGSYEDMKWPVFDEVHVLSEEKGDDNRVIVEIQWN